ncbi:hypothetical protein GUITHDRAFT_160761 [Guillardia theta CCMP2712]|uniref:Hexosyltransferase n=2 Tax=Guillardia theta TaxID=55529 RepID=L1K025_GUITC|nr:hypothetical protein GUITHDRAFT_160761 [Guillardia theta CCMP2712]EKX53972.1 hypothetical protein GUITHDRAFT_160761 [Guillardia theta CCMP2712]|eukprot:XP_005840952.1 hypothetical protein GUITHDRAFT_160761 [Guillardia theta CCMP2712]
MATKRRKRSATWVHCSLTLLLLVPFRHVSCKNVSVSYPFFNNITMGDPVRIAITMPITSRGDEDGPIEKMRFFNSFLPSFLETAIPTSFPCTFEFWIGYDKGDKILDNERGRHTFESVFRKKVESVSKAQQCGQAGCFKITMMDFPYSNTLTALWNGLNNAAFRDGCHYFFMPNDDLLMRTSGWPSAFLALLASSTLKPNLGVTGPNDPVSGRADIPSMPCVHRTHLHIFNGQTLPSTFQNWYNDVWLGNVYRAFDACLMAKDIAARNHDGCQDPERCSRYVLGEGAFAPWQEETHRGRLQVLMWLSEQGVAVSRDTVLNKQVVI